MREPTKEEIAFVNETIDKVFMRNLFEEWEWGTQNPYLFEVEVPFLAGEAKVIKAFNELFHVLDVLPIDANLGIGEAKDYCAININYDRETYSALFNVPSAKEFKRGDAEYQCTLKVIHGREMADRIAKILMARKRKLQPEQEKQD